VAVTLAYRGEQDAVSVPAGAIVRDVSGTAWVYEVVAEHQFERRRVEVERVDGGHAHLARGLAEGARVVVAGSVELFGFEFGAGK
jgi:multidrug efflux pump subunit AcrA (membrane-fusion protein)